MVTSDNKARATKGAATQAPWHKKHDRVHGGRVQLQLGVDQQPEKKLDQEKKEEKKERKKDKKKKEEESLP